MALSQIEWVSVPPPLVGGGEGEGKYLTTSHAQAGKIPKPLIKTAKTLRNRSTDSEMFLWKHLRAKQLEGLKFRRQQPIGKYIVDFVCFEKMVIVEVDGGQHLEADRDKGRDDWLISQNFQVLRFWNNEVLTNIQGVLEVIKMKCLNHPPLNPLPSREGKTVEATPIKGEGLPT